MHTLNTREFPNALFVPPQIRNYKSPFVRKIISELIRMQVRPTPERLEILMRMGLDRMDRNCLDRAFAQCEAVELPPYSIKEDPAPGPSRLSAEQAARILSSNPENREWITEAMNRTARRHGIRLPDAPAEASEKLFEYLVNHVCLWEADAFPLEAMTDLQNRYGWTFRTEAWSLREQLRQESRVILSAWERLKALADKFPLLLILNERAPSDYFTAALPPFARPAKTVSQEPGIPVLVLTGLKIASSEHRSPLEQTPEGEGLLQALDRAEALKRQPVFLDFSRRRFPRSFLRIARFFLTLKRGLLPLDKVRSLSSVPVDTAVQLPGPKASCGIPCLPGASPLMLLDPWPVSDPRIMEKMTPDERKRLCGVPRTKPWQDDRVGARLELEPDADGRFRTSQRPWIVPVPGGWTRTDMLFKSRLARFFPTDWHPYLPPDTDEGFGFSAVPDSIFPS